MKRDLFIFALKPSYRSFNLIFLITYTSILHIYGEKKKKQGPLGAPQRSVGNHNFLSFYQFTACLILSKTFYLFYFILLWPFLCVSQVPLLKILNKIIFIVPVAAVQMWCGRRLGTPSPCVQSTVFVLRK